MATAPDVASGNFVFTDVGGNNPPFDTPQLGDLYVAAIAYRGTANFTLPAGWALATTAQTSGNTDENLTTSIASGILAYIVRGASAPSFTFTRSGGDVAQGIMVAYRGNIAAPLDTGSSNTLGSASVTVTTPTITTAQDGELLVAASFGARAGGTSGDFFAATGATGVSGTSSYNTTPPAINAWTFRYTNGTGLSADVSSNLADAIMMTAGPTGTVQATMGTSARHAMAVAAFKFASL